MMMGTICPNQSYTFVNGINDKPPSKNADFFSSLENSDFTRNGDWVTVLINHKWVIINTKK